MDMFMHISGDYEDKVYTNTWTCSRTFLKTMKTKDTLTHLFMIYMCYEKMYKKETTQCTWHIIYLFLLQFNK